MRWCRGEQKNFFNLCIHINNEKIFFYVYINQYSKYIETWLIQLESNWIIKKRKLSQHSFFFIHNVRISNLFNNLCWFLEKK